MERNIPFKHYTSFSNPNVLNLIALDMISQQCSHLSSEESSSLWAPYIYSWGGSFSIIRWSFGFVLKSLRTSVNASELGHNNVLTRIFLSHMSKFKIMPPWITHPYFFKYYPVQSRRICKISTYNVKIFQ